MKEDFTENQNLIKDCKINNLSAEDTQKLLSVFIWLIQEDKKQNPNLYQFNKETND